MSGVHVALLASLFTASSLIGTASAGSSDRECVATDKSITMKGYDRVAITYTDRAKKKQTFDAPVSLMPEYPSTSAPDTIFAVPVNLERVVSKSHQTAHITHKDGSTCTGRERWDDRSVQRYVLFGRDGADLRGLFGAAKVSGMTNEGYIVLDFNCRSFGVTTAGGCFVDDESDELIWK